MNIIAILSLIPTYALAMDPSSLSLLLPTATPTGAADMWDCALSNYSPFFDPPKPTGTLLSAINSYGDKLLETCTEIRCPYPDATKWCGFTTAAPTAVLPAYTSYASTASVWWANHSALAMELAEECPHYWYKAATDHAIDAIWLNQTIIMAECIAKAPVGQPSSATLSATSSATSSTLLPSRTGATSSSPTSTGLSSASSTVLSSPSVRPIKLSIDGRCGGADGYFCPGSGFGECCSQYGWCGDLPGHCGEGCQLEYGKCEAVSVPASSTPTSSSSSPSSSPDPSSKLSVDGRCGGTDGYVCPGSGFGDCCSQYGWCGNDATGHCGPGCQPRYGICLISQPISPDGTCGSKNKGYICPGSRFGDCCSLNGFCGSSSAYCGGGCQREFGICDDGVNALTARELLSSPVELPITGAGPTIATVMATGTNKYSNNS